MYKQIEQPICTLYIKLAEIDATADLLYNAATEGDIESLAKSTIMSAMSNIQSMAKEGKEAVEEMESASAKPDDSVVTETNGNTAMTDVDQDASDDEFEDKRLHPAWFYCHKGEEVDVVESFHNCFNELDAIGDLLSGIDYDMNLVSGKSLGRVGCMLINKAEEGFRLVDIMIEQYQEAKKGEQS